MTKCEECQKDYDFTKDCVGWCVTCNKDPMCWDCVHTHKCIEGKSRQIRVITDPSWVVKLKVKNV